MASDLDLRALLRTHEPEGVTTLPQRVCEMGVERLDAQSVGVAIIADAQARTLLSSCGELAGAVEELQFALGEGPCLEAFHGGAPAIEPDLGGDGQARWPAFAEAALDLGVRAIFAFPLRIGPTRIGVLDVVRTSPGPLAAGERADADVLADIAAEAVLRLHAHSGLTSSPASGPLRADRLVVHQATGMVAAQTGVRVDDALARLRAHAYAEGRPLVDVATDVVARLLVFTP